MARWLVAQTLRWFVNFLFFDNVARISCANWFLIIDPRLLRLASVSWNLLSFLRINIVMKRMFNFRKRSFTWQTKINYYREHGVSRKAYIFMILWIITKLIVLNIHEDSVKSHLYKFISCYSDKDTQSF